MASPFIEQLLQRIEKLEKNSSGLNYYEITTENLKATGLAANQSGNFTTEIRKEGYYPIWLASETYNPSTTGFTVGIQRLTERYIGGGTLAFYAKNNSNGFTTEINVSVDVLWLKSGKN